MLLWLHNINPRRTESWAEVSSHSLLSAGALISNLPSIHFFTLASLLWNYWNAPSGCKHNFQLVQPDLVALIREMWSFPWNRPRSRAHEKKKRRVEANMWKNYCESLLHSTHVQRSRRKSEILYVFVRQDKASSLPTTVLPPRLFIILQIDAF